MFCARRRGRRSRRSGRRLRGRMLHGRSRRGRGGRRWTCPYGRRRREVWPAPSATVAPPRAPAERCRPQAERRTRRPPVNRARNNCKQGGRSQP
eukprot:1087336-Prorocentrum_minimum.AAC.1